MAAPSRGNPNRGLLAVPTEALQSIQEGVAMHPMSADGPGRDCRGAMASAPLHRAGAGLVIALTIFRWPAQTPPRIFRWLWHDTFAGGFGITLLLLFVRISVEMRYCDNVCCIYDFSEMMNFYFWLSHSRPQSLRAWPASSST